MATLYRAVKSAFRATVPRSANEWIFGGHHPLSRAILAAKRRLEQGAEHDDLYDEPYFRRQDGFMRESAKAIADTLVEKYRPKDAVDFGCGSGSILAALRERGVSVRGFDYAEGALRICREKGLDVAKFDLEAEATLPVSPVDLVISTEVAEHLPESVADRYVKLLCDASRHVIVMTAATPGQGGTDHVNEQPHAYWIEKFSANGFAHRADQTRETRQRWTELDVESNRASNVLIFTKQADSPSAT